MKPALAIFLSLLLTGCWLPDIRLKRDVSPEEVVGTWTMTDDSLRDIKTDSDASGISGSRKDYKIEIRKDGTLRYRSILQIPTRAVDYQGTWKLEPRTNPPKGNQLDILLDTNGGYAFSLDFTEEDGKLMIWTFFGDPDSWRLEKYEK